MRFGGQALKQNLTFLLQPEKLGLIWNTLQERIGDEDLALSDFGNAFLFLNAKGLKMDFKERGSLSQCMSYFEQHFAKIFD